MDPAADPASDLAAVGDLVSTWRSEPDAPRREALFRELLRRFQDAAFAWAYAILGDFHLAEDAAQEAFLIAWRHAGEVRDPAAFPGWFRRVVASQAHRVLRGRRAPAASRGSDRAPGGGEGCGGGPGPEAGGDPEARGDPEAAAERADLRGRVRRAVAALPAGSRAPAVLHYFGGQSLAEVAWLLGITESAVKNRLHAARARLRQDGEMQMAADGLQARRPSRDAGFEGRVSARLFPFRTDLAYYEARAEGLLSVWRGGLPPAPAAVRALRPHLSAAGDAEVRALPLAVEDARLAIARQHGAADWPAFAARIRELLAAGDAVPPFMAAYRAVEAGDAAALRGLLDAEPGLIAARGTSGNSLLNLAANSPAAQGPASACWRLLLERGADPNLANDRGWTPLHQAGYRNAPDLAEALLAAGADAGLSALGRGGTPLAAALFWGHREAAAVLELRGALPPNLRIAAGLGRLDLLSALLRPDGSLLPEAGRDRGFYRPHSGFPEWAPSDDPQEIRDEAFTYASRSGRFEAMALLLERGARIDADPYRGTALAWAAVKGRAETAAWLLDRGADPNRRSTFGGPGHGQGVTALHLAAQAGHIEVVRLLLERGADADARDGLFGGTPAGWAEHSGQAAVAELLRAGG